ncbi:hypothetical protein BZZ01_16940 [Nostocales cyanobacterium HT-58-2]|nr:hypothetical protein BZZ01_16940 [Nostocales cyanobacterium HT-58-2]
MRNWINQCASDRAIELFEMWLKTQNKQLTSLVTSFAHIPFLIQMERWGTRSFQGVQIKGSGVKVKSLRLLNASRLRLKVASPPLRGKAVIRAGSF